MSSIKRIIISDEPARVNKLLALLGAGQLPAHDMKKRKVTFQVINGVLLNPAGQDMPVTQAQMDAAFEGSKAPECRLCGASEYADKVGRDGRCKHCRKEGRTS
jgi:hypothetical protein